MAAADLVRVLVADSLRVRQAHSLGQVDHLCFGLRTGHHLVHKWPLGDLVAQGVGHVEGGRGALRDVGDAPAPEVPFLLQAEPENILALEADLTANETAAGPGIGHGRQRDGRLAGARLADQRQNFAAIHFGADLLDDREPHAIGSRPSISRSRISSRALI